MARKQQQLEFSRSCWVEAINSSKWRLTSARMPARSGVEPKLNPLYISV